MRTFSSISCFLLLMALASNRMAFAQTSADDKAGSESLSTRPTAVRIAEAISAGPSEISRDARIVEMGPGGKFIELRSGTNTWTCMPKQSETLPAMCVDPASMQWMKDFMEHKPRPTNLIPGITYMLAGATQRSDSDPYDKTSPLIDIGPHWMILWPFDPVATGLPTTHRTKGAYIMWGGTPYAHVHVVGSPYGTTTSAPHPK